MLNRYFKKADITEVFSSIQGEGIFLGAKQIFVRFRDCNLNCVFCDEPRDLEPKRYNSLSLISEIKALDDTKGPHHSVSLTGGEPLLYADFLREFLRLLKRNKFKSYLETNGTMPKELAKIIDMVDIVAMDFKLPSSTGERAYWAEHLEFLKIAAKKKVFVKAVVTPNTRNEDIEKAVSLVKKVSEKIPLILQPVTPSRSYVKTIGENRLLEFLEIVSRRGLDNIRIIPQVHKVLNVK